MMSWFQNPKTTSNRSWKAFSPIICSNLFTLKKICNQKGSCQQAPVRVLNLGQRPLPLQVPALPAGGGDTQGMTVVQPWYPARALHVSVESEMLSLWVLVLKQGTSWSGKEWCDIKGDVRIIPTWDSRNSLIWYGASRDCYWDSIAHTLPLLLYHSWLRGGFPLSAWTVNALGQATLHPFCPEMLTEGYPLRASSTQALPCRKKETPRFNASNKKIRKFSLVLIIFCADSGHQNLLMWSVSALKVTAAQTTQMANGLTALIQSCLVSAKELSNPLSLTALKPQNLKSKMQKHSKIMSTNGYLSFS